MIKRSFIGLLKPKIEYQTVGPTTPVPLEIAEPKKVTLLVEHVLEKRDSLLIKLGDEVKAGQRITVFNDSEEYIIATLAGKISAIDSYSGDQGKRYTAVTIESHGEKVLDTAFKECSGPSLAAVKDFFACLPGKPDVEALCGVKGKINTIVVTGMDPEMLVAANQYVIRYNCRTVKKGIEVLKKICGVENIVLTIPATLKRETQLEKMEPIVIDNCYPSAYPHMIVKTVFDQEIPAGQAPEDVGILFINAESVAAMADAFDTGRIPTRKHVTIVLKNGKKKMVSVTIGTALSSILSALKITVNDNDRIVKGGLLTGSAVYSTDYPIQPDTDAIIIQDNADIAPVSNDACTNCGDCIRICPTKVPVNLLVRFLEAGEYIEAADNYDLFSCIECGLCAYVCTARIPIFQYIKLAKYEHALIQAAEAAAAAAEAAADSAEAENA